MKSLNNFIVGISIGLLIPVFFGLALVLVATPSKLTTLTLLYSQIPAALANTYLDSAILQSRPREAVSILRKQAGYARMLGNNDLMKKRLVEDTYMVYEAVVDPRGYRALSDWVGELDLLLGDYDSYWFGVIRSHVDAVKNRNAFSEAAQELVATFPAFDRPYRPHIENAIRSDNYELLERLCQEYNEAKYNFIALNPYQRNRHLRGIYDGSIVLLGNSNAHDSAITQRHPALLTDRFVRYEFMLDRATETQMLRLSFRSIPGIRVRVKSVLFEEGEESVSYRREELLYMGKFGFLLEDGSYLIADNMQGDILTLFPRDGRFPTSDKVSLYLQFDKLPLVNYAACAPNPPGE